MNTKLAGFAMTFFAFSAIFGGHIGTASAASFQITRIVFKGPDAKMSLNIFKFQLRNKLNDLNLNLKFIATEKNVKFDIRGIKKSEIKKRLIEAISLNNNCGVIKENEPDQINAQVEYHDCLANANSSATIIALNKKQYPSWTVRLFSEGILTLAREEMVLEAINADSDSVSIMTSLASDVQQEVNSLRSNASTNIVSVVTQYQNP